MARLQYILVIVVLGILATTSVEGSQCSCCIGLVKCSGDNCSCKGLFGCGGCEATDSRASSDEENIRKKRERRNYVIYEEEKQNRIHYTSGTTLVLISLISFRIYKARKENGKMRNADLIRATCECGAPCFKMEQTESGCACVPTGECYG
ncbi:unnamed protein product [Owenia fusiformis]|uniref:Uncharacterized protein n=1 Tax=Owenia fusiformis TaxID=6347 RepID=A0A8S4NII7_OWEFU|nr:unnamed protein product [Owenia fusiformis]